MNCHKETQILREIYNRNDVDIDIVPHAIEEMEFDNISISDIHRLLAASPVTEVQPDGRWRVSGRNCNGKDFDIIIKVLTKDVTIIVITAFNT